MTQTGAFEQPQPLLALSDVDVTYGAIKALEGVSVSFAAGEIVGLLGHNGAGKSTLVNVACGAVAPSAGEIELRGQPVPLPTSPRLMQARGLHVVHQEPAVLPNLTVLDNLWLGRNHGRKSEKEAGSAREALAKVGLSVPLDMPVGALNLGARQLLSIARGLLDDSLTVLFLDEPAASLGQDDADRLHSLIQGLAKSGTGVVYVSHRLRDIAAVCSRYVVLRDGRLVEDRPMGDLTATRLAATLTGSEGHRGFPQSRVTGQQAPIELRSSNGIEARKGEILGLFGMAGAEQFQFLKDLFGISQGSATVQWQGRELILRNPADAIKQGIHMVQADREKDSLVGTLNAISNVMLPWYRRRQGFPRFRKGDVDRVYARSRAELSIKGPPGLAPIGAFSGGNRQKHVLARWMVPVKPRLLLLAQPTQGIDETSKREVREALWRLSDTGITVLVASAESDEIAELCDRAYVVLNGEFSEVSRSPAFEEDLLAILLTTSTPEGTGR